MTFIGWIKAQAEDVEFHRLEEFHFTMGAQEVNQGMDLGQEMGEGQPMATHGNPGSFPSPYSTNSTNPWCCENGFTGVATMRKGEVAMLDLSPEFAYGAEGCLAQTEAPPRPEFLGIC